MNNSENLSCNDKDEENSDENFIVVNSDSDRNSNSNNIIILKSNLDSPPSSLDKIDEEPQKRGKIG